MNKTFLIFLGNIVDYSSLILYNYKYNKGANMPKRETKSKFTNAIRLYFENNRHRNITSRELSDVLGLEMDPVYYACDILAKQGFLVKSKDGNKVLYKMKPAGLYIGSDSIYDAADTHIDSKMTFGVELEFLSKLNGTEINEVLTALELDHPVRGDGNTYSSHGHSISYANWNVTYDCSLTSTATFNNKMEIVSPILKGKKGLAELKKVMESLDGLATRRLVKINKSCGTHVHHGNFPGDFDVPKFINNYSNHQVNIDKLVARSRQNNRNTYCRAVTPSSHMSSRGTINYNHNRYNNVNLNHYLSRGCIELRQHQGTLLFNKVASWVVLGQSLIKKQETISEDFGIVNFLESLIPSETLKSFFRLRAHLLETAIVN